MYDEINSCMPRVCHFIYILNMQLSVSRGYILRHICTSECLQCINSMCFCCGQLLVKYENEVKLVALSVKLGSIVNLCDACNFTKASNDRRWGQLFPYGFYIKSKHLISNRLLEWEQNQLNLGACRAWYKFKSTAEH